VNLLPICGSTTPKDRCADILLDETIKFLTNNNTTLQLVEFCMIDNETLFHFKMKFKKLKQEKSSDSESI
jgi:O-acetyl-ADP-ribose deacetylase